MFILKFYNNNPNFKLKTGINMTTIEQCQKCEHHHKFEHGAIYCGYNTNIISIATAFNEVYKANVILACPKEQAAKR